MIWKHSKNDELIFSSEMSLDVLATKLLVLPMDSFGGQLSTASSSSITQGTLWVRELTSICEEIVLHWSFLLRILLSHFQSRELPRCYKQAGCYISPGLHVRDTERQILVRFFSNFVPFLCFVHRLFV